MPGHSWKYKLSWKWLCPSRKRCQLASTIGWDPQKQRNIVSLWWEREMGHCLNIRCWNCVESMSESCRISSGHSRWAMVQDRLPTHQPSGMVDDHVWWNCQTTMDSTWKWDSKMLWSKFFILITYYTSSVIVEYRGEYEVNKQYKLFR